MKNNLLILSRTVLFFLLLLPFSLRAQEKSNLYWYYYVIDNNTPTGAFTSLAYDKNGFPAIAYTSGATLELGRGVRFARFDSSSWKLSDVDPAGEGRLDLAFDPGNKPHIIYAADDQSTIMQAVLGGGNWVNYRIATSLNRGQAVYDRSLQADDNGLMHIVFGTDYSPDVNVALNITYATLTDSIVSQPQRIDSIGNTGKWSSLVLTDEGVPAVAYYTTFGDLRFAILKNGQWAADTVDADGFVDNQGFYPSLAVTSKDKFCIAFQSHTNSKLRFASGSPGDWQIEDITDLNGWSTFSTPNPLAIDKNGRIYVAYYDARDGDLRLAMRMNGTWTTSLVDSSGNVGKHAAIAINAEGLPSISYFDATNGFLRLAVASTTPPADFDQDGIPDYIETEYGLDPRDVDSDDDGLADSEEDRNGNGRVDVGETDPKNPDTDGDGVQDGTEQGRTKGVTTPAGIQGTALSAFHPDQDPGTMTNPLLFDTDADGLSDGEEDVNKDGRCDYSETDPNDPDTDKDGLADGLEVHTGTSPLDLDSDDDGLADNVEDKNLNGMFESDETSAANGDTDDDGVSDGTESGVVSFIADPDGEGKITATDINKFRPDEDPGTVTNPLDADTDRDGVKDGAEDTNGNGKFDVGETDPLNQDTDEDGLKDGQEIFLQTNPTDLDTDDDGLADGLEDRNKNGRIDSDETSPNNFDTDSDGLSDGLELGITKGVPNPDEESGLKGTDENVFVADADPQSHTDPLLADTDKDGLYDGDEDVNLNGKKDENETDPADADTDHDGSADGDEVNFGTDPLDADSFVNLSLLLRDNFSDASLADWTVVDNGTLEGPSEWIVYENKLLQLSNVYADFNASDPNDFSMPGTYIWRGNKKWQNYKISFNMISNDDDALGVMFRYIDDATYYRFSMSREVGLALLMKFQGGEYQVLSRKKFKYEKNHLYQINVFAINSLFSIVIDGERFMDVVDSDIPKGALAFYSWKNAGAGFSDLVVESPDGLFTRVNTALLNDFNISLDGNARVLTWRLQQIKGGSFLKLEGRRHGAAFRNLVTLDLAHTSAKDLTYTDHEPWLADTYRLSVWDVHGAKVFSQEFSAGKVIAKNFALLPSYPNPFSDNIHFTFQLPRRGEVHYSIYNVSGQVVRSDMLGILESGWHQFSWNGLGSAGQALPNGAYFVQFKVSAKGVAMLKRLQKLIKIQ